MRCLPALHPSLHTWNSNSPLASGRTCLPDHCPCDTRSTCAGCPSMVISSGQMPHPSTRTLIASPSKSDAGMASRDMRLLLSLSFGCDFLFMYLEHSLLPV